MRLARTINELRAVRQDWLGSVGFVPTMGALHAGHVSLAQASAHENDHTIASIFVNPTQFAAHEDLSKYPRTLEHDVAMFEAAGVDVVFTPDTAMMYPAGFQTWVDVTEITQGLEGERRPGHFRGVATVVTKLFHLVQPHKAYFGQKDAQQVAVIKQMVRDLAFPLEVVVCPTRREADGLAMSSRNVYLSAEERQAATVLYRALQAAGRAYARGQRSAADLRIVISAVLATEAIGDTEYVSVADAITLREVEQSEAPLLVSLVVRFGQTRLLDNLLLPLSLNTQEGLTQVLGGDGHVI